MLLLDYQRPKFSKKSSLEMLLPRNLSSQLKMALIGLGKKIHKIPYIHCQVWQMRF